MGWSVMTKKLLGKQLLRFKSIVALYSIICSILFSFSFAAPAGVFCINNGDESTSSTNVILNNKINIKLTEMRFSNDNKKFSKWEKFAKKKSWTLDPKPGVKTVYAEFRDGNKKHNDKKNDLHKKSDTIKLVSGSLKWQKSLGGTEFDAASSIRQTTDGGYIVAGVSSSNDGDVSGNHGGRDDYWIVKLTATGAITWQKSLGGSGDDVARSIQQTADGGYIVAGKSSSNDGDVSGNHGGYYDCWIVKLDAAGNITWQKSLGGSGDDQANSIQQTTDGGYVIAGWSDSNDGDVSGNHDSNDCWIVKLDATGDITWQKSLGGSGIYERALSIQQTLGGGYIVAGWSDSNDGDVSGNHGGWGDFWIVKLDEAGDITWQKCLGGSGMDIASSNSIQQTADGGYIVAGQSASNDGDVTGNHGISMDGEYYCTQDYWIVKLDFSGNIVWQKSLGGSGMDLANSIQQTTDGGYIVAGQSPSSDGDVIGNHGESCDYWILKLTATGAITWQKSLGGSGNDFANSIQQTTDGGYIVAGFNNSIDGDVNGNHGDNDFWIVKLDKNGEYK